MPANSSPETPGGFDFWAVPGRPNRVEYSVNALDEIRAGAEEGYYRLARGGLEIGGVLFGTRQGLEVRITRFRPVECEHALGPSFRLSPSDLERFQATLESVASDPELAGLEAVGWYHSHTRSDISFSEEDLQISERFFREPGQVALVVRPNHFAPTRAGFFCREADGSLRPAATAREFILSPLHQPAGRRAGVRKEPEPVQAPPEPAEVPAVPSPQQEPPARYLPARHTADNLPGWEPVRQRNRTGTAKLVWFAVIALALLASGAISVRRRLWEARPQPVSLQLKDLEGQLQIEWDRDATPVIVGTEGIIDFTDGSLRSSLQLDSPRLRQGKVTYARQTGKVDIRMRVSRSGQLLAEEFAQFLGPVPAQAPAAGNSPTGAIRPPEDTQLERRIDSVKLDMAQQVEQVQQSQVAVAAPLPPPNQAAATSLPITRAQQEPAQIYHGPLSGRLIWTGQLKPNAALSIYGGQASSGRVLGQLPGVPVRVKASPAAISHARMTVYSDDPNEVRSAEPPGPQNGYHRTFHTFNRKYTGELTITESPGARNAWRALTLHSRNLTVSTIVVSWEIVRN